MVSMRWVLLAVATVLVAWGSVVLLGGWQWDRATAELMQTLESARRAPVVERYDPAELNGLPAPVQRFFRTVLKPGQPIVTAVTLEQEGDFDMASDGQPNWKRFTAAQRVVATGRPGFVWDARIDFVPGLAIRVHDAYVAGAGRLRAAVAGLVTVAEVAATPALAEGELMRFFAEAAWWPTALLPSQGVRWQSVDEHSARATLGDGATSATLTFTFAADGTIERVNAEARGRTVDGRDVPTPWEGRWHDVQERSGMRVPTSGEVAWLTADGRRVYWRGTVTAVRYEVAGAEPVAAR